MKNWTDKITKVFLKDVELISVISTQTLEKCRVKNSE